MTRRAARHRLHPLVITAAMLLVLVAITFYAFNQGLPFVHKFTLSALVRNSVNVRSGDPVRIAGIDVGEVSGVAPAGDVSRITFTLNANGLPVHRNATLRIRDRLFLEGSYYLDLDPGTPAAPVIADGGSLQLTQTVSPVQAFQVLSTFDVAARANLKTLVAQLATGLGPNRRGSMASSGVAGLRTATRSLKPALSDVAIVSRAVRGTQPGDIGRLLTSASQVTGTLGASAAQLAGLVTALDVSSRALVASDGALGQSITGLDQTLQVAPPALRAIDHVLGPVQRLAQTIDPSLKAAPPLLRGLNGAVAELGAVLGPMQRGRLLASLRTTFQELPTVLTQLGRAFPITQQVSDCLRTHVTPLLQATVPDGSLSTGRPVWQDFVHFLPGVAGASASFDGNGPYTRVLAAAGDNTLTGGTGSGGGGGLLGGLLGGVLGPIVGTAPPGGGAVLGSHPVWAGDVTSADFRPDVPCAGQPLPNLASRTASVSLHAVRSPSAPVLNRTQLRAATAARVATITRRARAR
jgi:phospholipid/cholesterol/gamma-HCH transport system substrate-binding protein